MMARHLLMCAAALVLLSRAALAQDTGEAYDPATEQLSVAPVLVQAVQGNVRATTALNRAPFALREGAKVREGATITTGGNSRVSLVFSNGAVVSLSSNTKLKIDRFRQAGGIDLVPVGAPYGRPTTGTVAPVGSMEREPSYSVTDLFLSEGVAYARVKKLDRRSTYFLHTPLGSTKVLGTIWRQTHNKRQGQLEMVTTVEQDEGTTEVDPIDVGGKVNKPRNVRSGQMLQVTGTFANLADFNRFAAVESIQAVDVSVSVGLSVAIVTNLMPIEDPAFLSSLDTFLPQQLEDNIEVASKEIIQVEEDPEILPEFPIIGIPAAFGPGALGAFGGGGGTGPTPTPTPVSTPRPTPFRSPSPPPTPPPPVS